MTNKFSEESRAATAASAVKMAPPRKTHVSQALRSGRFFSDIVEPTKALETTPIDVPIGVGKTRVLYLCRQPNARIYHYNDDKNARLFIDERQNVHCEIQRDGVWEKADDDTMDMLLWQKLEPELHIHGKVPIPYVHSADVSPTDARSPDKRA